MRLAHRLLSNNRFMHTPTVLLVEDQDALRGLVRMVLERFGCRVIEASSGKEAVEKWGCNKGHVDLLLTDLMLPDGMNGRELANTLLMGNPNLKVVLTTGYTYEEASKGLPLPEGFHFIQKPYTPPALIQTIKMALMERQALAA
jgi:CheY-like chemotaxis protein